MNVLMGWISGRFDLVGWTKIWLVIASTMVRDEVIFWKETLLKNLMVSMSKSLVD